MKRRGRRRRGSPLAGILAIIASVLVIVFIGGFYIFTRPGAIDSATLCPVYGELSHYLVVIDKSDKWTDAQTGRLSTLIQSVGRKLLEGEKLSIFTIGDRPETGFAPLFSLCRPVRGRDVSILSDNPRRREKEFERKFGRRLAEVAEKVSQPTDAKVSPILEAFADLVNRSELLEGRGSKYLIIVSDMLQNSRHFSIFTPEHAVVSRPPNKGTTVFGWSQTVHPAEPKKPPKMTPSILPTKSELEKIVDAKGGLRHCHMFDLEVQQIPGGKYENKLLLARKFWESVFDLYGCRVRWKML